MKRKNRALIYFLAFAAAGCSPVLFLPTIQDAQRSGVPLTELQQGRSIYVNKCGSCHNLYLPEQYKPMVWQEYLEKMQTRAGINDDEKTAILKYINSAQSP
jgi:mono/diheme cytochrome c family protein